ncbi:hypothetical protein HanXRQr2_Chr14g0634791 [Helianthus annuus]|uniref:Uncharacterized protein n=1 Tax=Helianthus annuus TaxID=4232 RepID=A0A9K3H6Y5_HELAN|nr:hypothetical protein HanXRQr2_Chr14g0634791 [Helianthus annuus]KAJ0467750.1 hypothetical protein HanIR_Chr14g0688721 [Helianthus annuus]KAJ0839602.1 hypothetical protein HanPSC8_Chr14g0608811 [Helianthus annuus]
MVQMCRILGCIYRKRQHAGHGPVSGGHGPVCRQDPDTFYPYSDVKSEGNLLVDTGACWLGTAPCQKADYEDCLFSRNLSGSSSSLLDGTTPKCLRYLNCSRLRRERKRLSVRVIHMLNVGGQVQPFSGLSLKKVYAESLRSMYASNEVDGESFTAKSA